MFGSNVGSRIGDAIEPSHRCEIYDRSALILQHGSDLTNGYKWVSYVRQMNHLCFHAPKDAHDIRLQHVLKLLGRQFVEDFVVLNHIRDKSGDHENAHCCDTGVVDSAIKTTVVFDGC